MRAPKVFTLTMLMTGCLLVRAGAGELDLSWYTIDCGGGYSSGGTYELHGTIGQPDAAVLTGGEFTLRGGFWVGQSTDSSIPGDCNGDGDVDAADHADFYACLSGPDGGLNFDCACFNFDGDADVDLADFAWFQVSFTGS